MSNVSNRAIDVALKSAENQLVREMTSKFAARMAASVKDIGHVDTMRHSILTYVVSENYERAAEDLKRFVAGKTDYPQFATRAGRYVSYALDLINGVKAKRSFPGFQHLSAAKQQELFDKAMAHFEDLKATLRKIEQIDRELKMADVRSTILVVKAAIYCAFAIFVCAFALELSRGIWPTVGSVTESVINRISDQTLGWIGL